MPEIKRNENILKVRTNVDKASIFATTTAPPSRPSSRHKRHVDTSFLNKPSVVLSQDRKGRKRKTFEKVGASVVSFYYVYCVLYKLVCWTMNFIS